MMKSRFLKSLKVLLVEDEEKLALLLKRAIGESFYSFLVAKDGVEGLEIYKKISPDIVITDIMMPNKTGLEMAKEIKKLDPKSNIIILSAYSEVDKLLGAIDVGVMKYFIKPFDPDEVLEYIASLEESIGEQFIEVYGEFRFNKTTKGLYKNNRYVPLSKKEVAFLEMLLKEYETITYKQIKKELWDEDVSDERVRTFIKRFREKTSKDILQNIKGRGYRLSPNDG